MVKRYIAGGIVIESDIHFPEFVLSDAEPDVRVAYGKVPEEIENVKTQRVLVQSNDNEVLLKMPGVARYLIEGDSKITLELLDENRRQDAERYILTFILGVLSFKKGFFPLHGGGVVYNGEAYLFTGYSGAGKSTTLAGLAQRGFQPLADDISNFFVENGKVYVHPCFPRLKLWKDSLQMLKNEGVGEYKLGSDIEKYLVPLQHEFPKGPIPVKRIYLLQEDREDKIFMRQVSGKEKLIKLKNNSYKPWMVKAFSLNQKHFSLMNEIVAKTEFREFHRPMDKKKIDEMYDFLINDIKG
ncbi:MAG: hypothetical protein ACKOXB_06280 [Flavobacteriales bacterium]